VQPFFALGLVFTVILKNGKQNSLWQNRITEFGGVNLWDNRESAEAVAAVLVSASFVQRRNCG